MENLQSSKPVETELLVSFFDLTRFVSISSKMDNLEIYNFVSEFSKISGDLIEEKGGRMIKFIGDSGLAVFPQENAGNGVLALLEVKQEIESWIRSKGLSNTLDVKVHFGPVVCGPVGSTNNAPLDVVGKTVHVAAKLPGSGFSISPQAFRTLAPEQRKLFKKHTPPITYIPVEQRHQTN